MDSKIEAMVLSTQSNEAMKTFYSQVFAIDFSTEDVEEHSIYTGTWSGMAFTLVPAELTQVTADEGRYHFDVYVSDLEEGIRLTTEHGGRTNNQLGENEDERAIGIYDPDGNFLVLKQRK